ncbi:glycoside hydrolase family 70 protein, partial [Lentilactobacillus hilgardii]|uniref:glycoside hydrolase family 70 protein n=1 Tax=Lentilactobacillus hilgardii TaxID=1588 RepID=UPI00390C7126
MTQNLMILVPNFSIGAKYFNGTNIQGRGAWYVLKDWGTNQYFNVSNNQFVPKQFLGTDTYTGFNVTNEGTQFYSTSGYKAQNTFIQDGDNWYYFDNNGYMVTGLQNINGNNYYFLPNGIELQDSYLLNDDTGKEYYYASNGKQISNRYYPDANGNWRYFFNDGSMARNGLTTIEQPDGQKVIQYFDSDGIQLKGNAAKDNDGNLRYFDGNTGDMVVNSFGELPDGSWLYLNDKGITVTGEQEINGQTYYFDADGKQVKNDFRELPDGSWLYLNDKGIA